MEIVLENLLKLFIYLCYVFSLTNEIASYYSKVKFNKQEQFSVRFHILRGVLLFLVLFINIRKLYVIKNIKFGYSPKKK